MTRAVHPSEGQENDPDPKVKNGFEENSKSTEVDPISQTKFKDRNSNINSKEKRLRDVSLFELFRFATRKDLTFTITGVILAAIAGLIQPLGVLLSGRLANLLIYHSEDTDMLWNQGMLLVAVNAIIGVFVIIVTFFMFFCLRMGCINITDTLRIEFLKSLLRQDNAWFSEQKFGALNSMLNENVEHIRSGISDRIGFFVRCTIMALTTMSMGVYYNWQISLIIAPCVPLCGLCTHIMSKMVSRMTHKELKVGESAGAILQESLMNVKTIQSCNGQTTMIGKYTDALSKGRFFSVMGHVWSGLFNSLFFMILYVCYGIGVYYGCHKLTLGEINPGEILIVVNSWLFAGYLIGITSPHFSFIYKAKTAASVIYEIIDRKPSIDSTSSEGKTLNNPKGEITFKDVSFEYPNRRGKKVLDRLNLSVKAGETVALIGKSGSGKSTCLSLLGRLYDCTGGQIEIDGVDIRQLNIRFLREMIGIVQQEPILFNGTIAENVTLGRPHDKTQLESICRLANAHEFIERLEHGYQTRLGSSGGGVQLSGGQKQRLAIARTLFADPKILLLDEATSALDVESEIKVQEALKTASEGRTTIVIAHRLSTLRNVDRIVVIDKGQVIETGTHSELLSNPENLYSKLLKAQQFENRTVVHDNASDNAMASNLFINRHKRASECMSHSEISIQASLLSFSANITLNAIKRRYKTLNSGLIRFYRNCNGNYGKLIFSTIVTFFRSFELVIQYFMLLQLFNVFNSYAFMSNEEFMDSVLWIALGYAGIGIYLLPTMFGSIAIFGWTGERVIDDLKVKAFSKTIDQDASFFDQPQTSNAKVIQRISRDSLGLKAALDFRAYYVFNNSLGTIEVLIMAALFCWEITLAGLILCVLEVVLLVYMEAKMQDTVKELAIFDDSSKAAIEIIENVKTMQLLTSEDYFLKNYMKKTYQTRSIKIKTALYESAIYAMTRAFVYLFYFVGFGYAIYLIYHGLYSTNRIFIVTQLLAVVSDSLICVSIYLNDCFNAGTCADSLFELINSKSQIRSNSGQLESKINGDVELRGVEFAYPTRPKMNVADGLSLWAGHGESIALVGPSGGGKSTVLNLLLRFYEANQGKLKVDATNVREFDLDYLRSKMALVGQEPMLFSGTIAENISLGCSHQPSFEEIRNACKIANAANFIEQLPMGYSTEVGEKGAQLSGGQKQRIAIARALVRNPKILLLDEATSALDAQSEQAVQKALDSAREGRTCITIAHRLASIQSAHRIYYIENGKVTEYGTHEELHSMPASDYAKLFHKQTLKYN